MTEFKGLKQLSSLASSFKKGIESKRGFSSETTMQNIGYPIKKAANAFNKYDNFLKSAPTKIQNASKKAYDNSMLGSIDRAFQKKVMTMGRTLKNAGIYRRSPDEINKILNNKE